MTRIDRGEHPDYDACAYNQKYKATHNIKQLAVWIDKDLREEFKMLTIAKGDTMSEIVRRAIEEYIDAERKS